MTRRGVMHCLISLVAGMASVRTSAADCGIAEAFQEESERLGEKYANYKTREEILQGLREMFYQDRTFIATITAENMNNMVVGMRSEQMTRLEAALVAVEDQMDHYGNFVVYLRINGVVAALHSKLGAGARAEHSQAQRVRLATLRRGARPLAVRGRNAVFQAAFSG